MGDTKTEFLNAAKLILGINDGESDELLLYLIDDTENAVLSYCRLDVLPRQLSGFIPKIAAERFTENRRGAVRAITEGERRVEYGDTKIDFLSAHEMRLKPFVSRAVKLPSDLGDTKDD